MLHRSAFSSYTDCRTQMHSARQGVVSPEMAASPSASNWPPMSCARRWRGGG